MTLEDLERDAVDAENESARCDKALIDAQLEAERAHRRALDARRAVTRMKYEKAMYTNRESL